MQVNQVRAGAILSYVSMAVSTILSLVYAPIMKGQLGTSEYGVYGSVGPIIAYLLLLSMGLGSAYMRYYSQAKVAQDRRTMAKLNGMFLVTYTVLGLVLLATTRNELVCWIGVALIAMSALFSLITLPVEYNASARALEWLESSRTMQGAQLVQAREALTWAARTYLVAALGAIASVLYYVFLILGRRD